MQSHTTSPGIDLLTDKQVGEISGVKPKTLANWRCKGLGPAFVKVGAQIRYRPEDLKAFLDSRIFQSTTEYGSYRAEKKVNRDRAEQMQ